MYLSPHSSSTEDATLHSRDVVLVSVSCFFSLFSPFELSLMISRLISCAIFVCRRSALERRAGLVPAKDVSHR
jgi:hypothetical protein